MATATIPNAIAFEKLGQISHGFLASSALNAITRLGVADVLDDKSMSIEELASKTSANKDALCRVLRLLCSLGVFEEVSEMTFANNETSHLIKRNAEGSMRDMLLFMANPFHFRAYTDMLPTILDGKTAAHHMWGKEIFEVFAEDKEEQQLFDNAMTTFSRQAVPQILDAYDFSGIAKLVDVAGGYGALLTSILLKHTDMHGVLFDLPHLANGAKQRIEELKLSGRCDIVSGDFFKSVPGGDAIIMKHIIHDWDDEQAIKILKNCREAGVNKVLLVEMLLADGHEPHPSKFMDIEMMMLPGGRERTEKQFSLLFENAGFSLKRTVRTKGPLVVLEATPS